MLFAASSSGSNPLSLVLFLALPVALYFLMIRPQKRKMQAQQALAKSIGEGDEIVTTSGVYGFVTAIEGDVVWLEIADGVDIRITRGAILKRVTPADIEIGGGDAPVAADEPEPAAPDAAK